MQSVMRMMMRIPSRFASGGGAIGHNRFQSSQESQVKAQQARNAEVAEFSELVRDFLPPDVFYKAVTRICDIDFFTGVPDSLLKDFCAYVDDNTTRDQHVIAANEGSALGIAAGHYLATNKPALVYLQNSGFGNVVNPLMSLMHKRVYRIPALILVGWRGEPGKRDEPQHQAQGQVTTSLCASLGLPFETLPDYEEGAEEVLGSAANHLQTIGTPFCLLVRRQTFLPYKTKKAEPKFDMNREEALVEIVDKLNDKDVIISTTGMLSRELFELRARNQSGHEKDFLTVGSMGHATSIALGIAMKSPRRQVMCFDGDGAALMHLGNMATIGQSGLENFKHVLFNNGVHDSVGGQQTCGGAFDSFSFSKLALACGYKEAFFTDQRSEVKDLMAQLRSVKGPAFLEVRVNPGHRKDIGRPTTTPAANKKDFMHFLAIGR